MAMLQLRDCRYIEGAPFEWRRALTPGTPVEMTFDDRGLSISAAAGVGRLAE
jgi:hypothetical protein